MKINKAFAYVKKCVSESKPLGENIVKDKPSVPSEMYYQIKEFFSNMNSKSDLNPIELAAWTHAELEEQQLDEYLSIF